LDIPNTSFENRRDDSLLANICHHAPSARWIVDIVAKMLVSAADVSLATAVSAHVAPGVKNMFELHAGVKTKEIIDNQEASCSQQQESLYRIVEYNTGEEIDEAGGAVAPAGPADEHDVAAAGLQHVAGILQEVLVGSQANPKPKLGRANGGGGVAADVEMAEEDHDGEDDGMLALTRPGTSEEEAGFQVRE
jgi:hypothetical protein